MVIAQNGYSYLLCVVWRREKNGCTIISNGGHQANFEVQYKTLCVLLLLGSKVLSAHWHLMQRRNAEKPNLAWFYLSEALKREPPISKYHPEAPSIAVFHASKEYPNEKIQKNKTNWGHISNLILILRSFD